MDASNLTWHYCKDGEIVWKQEGRDGQKKRLNIERRIEHIFTLSNLHK